MPKDLKIVSITEIFKKWGFENLSYILLGKGKYVVCEYDSEVGWYPICGENRFVTKRAAEIAIRDRIELNLEVSKIN